MVIHDLDDLWVNGVYQLIVVWLVVWNMNLIFKGKKLIQSDELIFFRGVGIPPTSW